MGHKAAKSLPYHYHCLGQVDSSGARIYYTDQLRQYDSGALAVGIPTSEWLIIPPKQKSWMSIGYCTEKCTKVNETVSQQGTKKTTTTTTYC